VWSAFSRKAIENPRIDKTDGRLKFTAEGRMKYMHNMLRSGLLVVTARLLFCDLFAVAGDDKAEGAKVQIEKLALFKNGLGFVVSIGELPRDAQTVRIGQLPIPSLGTFWIGYPKDVRLQSAVTSMEELEIDVPVQSIGQLLQMNVGRKVLIHTSDRDIEGTILVGPAPRGTEKSPSPYFMSPQAKETSPYSLDPSRPAEILMMRTEKGIVALYPGSIQRAEFSDSEPISTTRHKQKCPSILLKLERPSGGERISVSYLAKGVTWVPSYLIDLSDSKNAKFSAHAIVINEMTDLDNVKLQLVTGFPNIKFSGIQSPMAKNQSLADFLRALSGSGGRQEGLDLSMLQQGVLANAMGGFRDAESALVPDFPGPAEGEVAEDLYFYPVKNLTLKKDETAWIPLFTAEMPYKHIYTWKIRDFVDNDDRYRTEKELQDRKAGEEIWHSCRFTNTLSMPLTTAATEFVTNGELTGQDVCYYTPPGAETTVRINKALNLMAEQAETEVERKRDATTFYGYHYDLVKVRGDLRLRNRLAKETSVEITKELSGEVLESLPKSKDTKTAAGLKKVNPKHILTWSIDLKPGEERKVSYQYQVYIRD
jgi:hypothetical protein